MKATNILNVLCVVFVLALSGCTSKAVRVCLDTAESQFTLKGPTWAGVESVDIHLKGPGSYASVPVIAGEKDQVVFTRMDAVVTCPKR